MLVRFIRNTLGRIPGKRRAAGTAHPGQVPGRPRHAARNGLVPGLVLYQYRACPYCMITRRAIDRLGLTLEMRDVRSNPRDREELLAGGGRLMVPCLMIEDDGDVRWMYESRDIIDYLQGRFDRG